MHSSISSKIMREASMIYLPAIKWAWSSVIVSGRSFFEFFLIKFGYDFVLQGMHLVGLAFMGFPYLLWNESDIGLIQASTDDIIFNRIMEHPWSFCIESDRRSCRAFNCKANWTWSFIWTQSWWHGISIGVKSPANRQLWSKEIGSQVPVLTYLCYR